MVLCQVPDHHVVRPTLGSEPDDPGGRGFLSDIVVVRELLLLSIVQVDDRVYLGTKANCLDGVGPSLLSVEIGVVAVSSSVQNPVLRASVGGDGRGLGKTVVGLVGSGALHGWGGKAR